MSAGIYNFDMDQGATYTLDLTWTNINTGNPINLTGYSAKMQLRKEYDSTSVALTMSTANGKIVLGGAAGTILATAQAADLNFSGRYVYDLELTSGGGAVTRLIMGMILVRPEVTQ